MTAALPPLRASAPMEADLDHEQIWSTYARSYDEVLPNLDFYRAALLADDVRTIIDIGAGTGSVALPLLRCDRHVTSVDNSRAMLDRLLAKLPDSAEEQLIIARQTAEDLSAWRDGTFDGVNILLALFDMPDPEAALGHAVRVLRPGGLLVVTEPKRSFDLKDLLAYGEGYLRGRGLYERLQPHWQRVCEVNRKIDPARRLSSMPLEDILAVLDAGGFRVASVCDSHHHNCATVIARKANEGPRR